MKTWITQTVAGVVALATLSLTACKKDEVQATLTPSSTAPALTASASTLVLTQANAANTAVTYTWTPLTFTWANAEHPYNLAVTYTLQLAKQGTNFASAVAIDAGAGPTKTFNVADLDAALLSAGVTPGTATPVEVRLRAIYAANSPIYSAAVPLTATVYAFCAQPSASQAWAIIGQAAKGWSTDVAMTYNCDNKTYSYTGPFIADEYKFRYGANDATTGNWKANLGGTSSTGGALTQDGPNLKITTAGTYTIVLTPSAIGADGKATGGTFTIK